MLSAKRYDAIHNRRFQLKLALLLLHSLSNLGANDAEPSHKLAILTMWPAWG